MYIYDSTGTPPMTVIHRPPFNIYIHTITTTYTGFVYDELHGQVPEDDSAHISTLPRDADAPVGDCQQTHIGDGQLSVTVPPPDPATVYYYFRANDIVYRYFY